MTDIEQKALALVNEVRREYPNLADYNANHIALCRAIEQHDAFRQEVSDTLEAYLRERFTTAPWEHKLRRFVTTKPDPLVRAINEVIYAQPDGDINEADMAKALRAALEARGLEIREKGA